MRVLLPPVVTVAGLEVVGPAAGTVLVDSGAVPAGLYQVVATWANDDFGITNIVQIAHRNAANAADLELLDQPGGVANNVGSAQVAGLMQLALNERVVMRNLRGAAGGRNWQCRIQLFLVTD
jgi:bifunctional N-acetylglucosamine-1-phosphate-uridyltransferase/glucosamine-1-phosphate-acetyltransferase GlmU-like protein